MSVYAAQLHGEDGTGVSFGAVVEAGDTFKLTGRPQVLRFRNSGAGAHVATIAGVGFDNQGFANRALVFTIPALTNTPGWVETPLLRSERFGANPVVTYDASSTGEVTAAQVDMNDDKGQA